MRRAVLAAAIGIVALGTSARAQVDVALLTRVAAYVETFERQFGSMVAEERYDQFTTSSGGSAAMVRGSGPAPQQTTLKSDFLLVQVPGQGWVPFRDVFERDGKAVRDRQDRLTSLFIEHKRDALEQARRISDESSRYNIGNVQRTINVPTLVLNYLAGDFQYRVSFSEAKPDDAAAGRVVAFKEVVKPTFIHTSNDRDLPAAGRVWVDEQTGAVHRTELDVLDATVEAHIVVTFQLDETTNIWVPAKMEERYRRPNSRDTSELRGIATYSRFRRFSVSTTEDIQH